MTVLYKLDYRLLNEFVQSVIDDVKIYCLEDKNMTSPVLDVLELVNVLGPM